MFSVYPSDWQYFILAPPMSIPAMVVVDLDIVFFRHIFL